MLTYCTWKHRQDDKHAQNWQQAILQIDRFRDRDIAERMAFHAFQAGFEAGRESVIQKVIRFLPPIIANFIRTDTKKVTLTDPLGQRDDDTFEVPAVNQETCDHQCYREGDHFVCHMCGYIR